MIIVDIINYYLNDITHPLYPGPLGPRQGSTQALDRLQTVLRNKTWPHHDLTRLRPAPTSPTKTRLGPP